MYQRQLEQLWPFDLDSMGSLLKRVCGAYDVNANQLAKQCGVSEPTLSRFLNGETRKPKYFDICLQKLQIMSRPKLTAYHVRLLRELYHFSHDRESYEASLARISFKDVKNRRYPQLQRLVDELTTDSRPAFIFDSAFHVHVLNDALLKLFNLAIDDPHLQRWEGWHVVASKVYPRSPIYRAHAYPDGYFPQTIAFYFEYEAALPFWFTRQMRQVIYRTQQLADLSGLQFSRWWYNATSLSHGFDLTKLERSLWYTFVSGIQKRIYTDAVIQSSVLITEEAKYPVTFSLAVWEPKSGEAEIAFREIIAVAQQRKLYFAADYDNAFHVNDWLSN